MVESSDPYPEETLSFSKLPSTSPVNHLCYGILTELVAPRVKEIRKGKQDEDRETQPREEDEISRHIHEVFDQGLNHLPDGIVENPWSDLEDKTEKAADPSIKKQTEEATDFSVAAMLKDPVSRKQLFILREVLDRPQNLWE